jgi:hypothetical protein
MVASRRASAKAAVYDRVSASGFRTRPTTSRVRTSNGLDANSAHKRLFCAVAVPIAAMDCGLQSESEAGGKREPTDSRAHRR